MKKTKKQMVVSASESKKKVSDLGNIYQIKITLKNSRPPIWRKIQVTDNTTLDELHDIIQTVMGWDDCHLHQFIIEGEYYGEPDPDYSDDMENETGVKLSKIISREKYKFMYEYDFGDSWLHEILVEKILPFEKGGKYPVCISGKRACPPDDVGGVWGYEAFVEAVKDKKNPDHEEMLDWIGGSFDPEEFDIDAVNKDLGV